MPGPKQGSEMRPGLTRAWGSLWPWEEDFVLLAPDTAAGTAACRQDSGGPASPPERSGEGLAAEGSLQVVT